MNHGFILRRRVLCSVLVAMALGCDGSAPDGPGTSDVDRARVPGDSSKGGQAAVELVFNTTPRVVSMTSSVGRLVSDSPVTLQVEAIDKDGDPLTYQWDSNCPGAFDRADLSQVTFAVATLTEGAICAFDVRVSDGRGGVGKGTLSLSSAAPEVTVGGLQ